MALSSSSTIADALAQYDDNLSWEGDVAKATLYLEAIRYLLVHRPQTSSIQGRSLSYTAMELEKAKVAEFVNKFGANVKRASFVRGKMRI